MNYRMKRGRSLGVSRVAGETLRRNGAPRPHFIRSTVKDNHGYANISSKSQFCIDRSCCHGPAQFAALDELRRFGASRSDSIESAKSLGRMLAVPDASR